MFFLAAIRPFGAQQRFIQCLSHDDYVGIRRSIKDYEGAGPIVLPEVLGPWFVFNRKGHEGGRRITVGLE